MKTAMMSTMREWLFPVAVLAFWAVGFTYTLTRLGEAHRTHALAAAERVAPRTVAPELPAFASAQ
ncbi:MAG: hypothetical protein ACXWLR_06370 [Myxococcales bacterium]